MACHCVAKYDTLPETAPNVIDTLNRNYSHIDKAGVSFLSVGGCTGIFRDNLSSTGMQ